MPIVAYTNFKLYFSHNKVDTTSKVSFLISKYWIESVNATMEIDVQRTWGYKDPKTGLFSGMAGRLQLKEADISGEYNDLFLQTNLEISICNCLEKSN